MLKRLQQHHSRDEEENTPPSLPDTLQYDEDGVPIEPTQPIEADYGDDDWGFDEAMEKYDKLKREYDEVAPTTPGMGRDG